MLRIYKALACVALAGVIAACGGSDSSKNPQPASPKAAPDAKRVDSATAATVKGKVLFEGTAPENAVIKMSSDSACGAAETRGESYVVDNGGLKNVFVYIKDGLGNKYIFDTPTQAVVIDQKGCHYVPHGDGGKFELRGVPPGTYSVEAVHEKLGRVSLPVTLGEKDSKELTFTFKAQ